MSAPAPVSKLAVESLTGSQKCAIVCVSLGPDVASKLLRQLSSDQVERVTQEIAALPPVPPEVVAHVLREFQQSATSPPATAQGGMVYAREVLEHAFGAVRARALVDRIEERGAPPQLRRLKQAAPDLLAGLLRDEHPQAAALVLAHLDAPQAIAVLGTLEVKRAAEVLYRMAKLDPVAPETLAQLEGALSGRTDLTFVPNSAPSGGPASVARLLNLAGGGDRGKEVLEALGQRDGDLAEKVKALMFVFEDLLLIDGRGVQRLLRDVESRELALALKAASDELKAHIRANMSERAGQALEEEIEMLGPVRVKDVEAAQTHIIESVRALEESGEILVRGRGGSDDVIA